MDNDFTDFLSHNWNEKFKAASTSLEQLQQHQQQQELQKINTFSPNTNRLFLDELNNIRSHQQQQHSNTTSQLDIRPTYASPASTYNNAVGASQQQQLQSNLSRSSLNRLPSTINMKEFRLNGLASTAGSLRLPDDTTISRSTLTNSRGSSTQIQATNATTFTAICSSMGGGLDTADSTTPPPSIQSASSSSNAANNASSISVSALVGNSNETDKKTANSIRGNRLK